MRLQGNPTPLQVLRGSIRSLNAISLDRSLTRDGYCADARAAGEGIAQAKQLAAEHGESRNNPHAVTKAQVGLGNADNTADIDKPVSTAQAAAIDKVRQAALEAANDAKAAASKAHSTAGGAQTAADTAKAAADNAQAAADAARAAADQAQATADQKTAWFTASVTLESGGWRGLQQTAMASGVTELAAQPILVTPAEGYQEAYGDFGIKVVSQGENALTFSCTEVPEVDIALQILGFTVPKEGF